MEAHEVSKIIFNTLSGLIFDLKDLWRKDVEGNEEFAKGVLFGLEEMFSLITSLRAELKPQLEGTTPKVNALPPIEPESPK